MTDVEEKVIKKYAKTIELSDSLKVPLLNWGYWPEGFSEEQIQDRSDASLRLIHKLVKEAGISSQHQVLDVGCGPGGTSVTIQEASGCQQVTGVDICGTEIAYASMRLAARPDLQGLVSYQEMNATDLYFPGNIFDRVVAVECAFHFQHRINFLKEAYRVLKPDGQLVLTDWIKGRSTNSGVNKKLGDVALKFWGIPEANIIEAQSYKAMLKDLGFSKIRVESMADHVIPHYINYICSKRGQRELLRTTGLAKTWTYTAMLQAVKFLYKRGLVDYVFVKAEKE